MQVTAAEINDRFNQSYILSSSDLAGIVDCDMKITRTTKSLSDICGFKTFDALLGLTNYDLKSPAANSAPQFEQQFQKVIKTGQALTMVDIHTYANDEIKLLSTVKQPIVELDGSVCSATVDCYEHENTLLAKNILKNITQYINNHDAISLSLELIDTYSHLNLTTAESECFYYYIRGYTYKEIGQLLHRSPRTIEEHIANIKHKLGTKNRYSIVEYAVVYGLLFQIPKTILNRLK